VNIVREHSLRISLINYTYLLCALVVEQLNGCTFKLKSLAAWQDSFDLDLLYVMTSTDIVTTYDDAEHRKEVTFSPPLYRQRYDLAASILQEAKVTSVCLIVFFSTK